MVTAPLPGRRPPLATAKPFGCGETAPGMGVMPSLSARVIKEKIMSRAVHRRIVTVGVGAAALAAAVQQPGSRRIRRKLGVSAHWFPGTGRALTELLDQRE